MDTMLMDRGLGYCGLACIACGENITCVGCRNDGCMNREWCTNRNCCISRDLKGCWACEDFPCTGGMLNHLRIRAFARFIKENGEAEFIRCLERNEKAGIVYHREGEQTGDYDQFDTEERIIQLIKTGE